MLDQLDTRVERLRKEAMHLQDKRDHLLISLDLIKNNDLFANLEEREFIIKGLLDTKVSNNRFCIICRRTKRGGLLHGESHISPQHRGIDCTNCAQPDTRGLSAPSKCAHRQPHQFKGHDYVPANRSVVPKRVFGRGQSGRPWE